METENQPKKKYRHPDHVTLNPTSLSKIAGWIEQMSGQMKGASLSKANIVECLIEWHSELLTGSECKKIKDKFFDDVKFHEWAVREYKKQRAGGLGISFSEFLLQNQSATKMETDDSKKRVRAKKTVNSVEKAESKDTNSVHVSNAF